MRVLTIYAHPNPKSFCHAVLERFTQGLAEAGHSNEVVDLYAIGFDPVWSMRDSPNWLDESIPQDILDRTDLRREMLDGARNPVERFLIKHWLGDKDTKGIIRALRAQRRPKDVTEQQEKVARAEALVFGFAFNLSEAGWHGDVRGRIPLLQHEKALIISTTIFDETTYRAGFGDAIRRLTDEWCLLYPGIKSVEHVFLYGVNGADDETRQSYLERAHRLGREFAGTGAVAA